MKITFVDTNPMVVESLLKEFVSFPCVKVLYGDLLKVAQNCVVSPANSYGFMDGGIDKDYLSFFGPSLQQKVSEVISSRSEGYLPVGASALISTGHAIIPHLILAPTMVSPEFIPPDNVYRAMRAILRLMRHYRDTLADIYCPGLGTGVGGVAPEIAASCMAEAYRDSNSDN
jgi:O-acetyl-ADP-ribose deacetylase (regulator of RNase III)